jgi:hypothetical protein
MEERTWEGVRMSYWRIMVELRGRRKGKRRVGTQEEEKRKREERFARPNHRTKQASKHR